MQRAVRVRGPVAKLKLIEADGSEPGLFSQGMSSSNLATSGKLAGRRWMLQRCWFEVKMGRSPFLAVAAGDSERKAWLGGD